MQHTFFLFGRDHLGRGGPIWLASLTSLQSQSGLSISKLRQPTCRLRPVTWPTAPTDCFVRREILPSHSSSVSETAVAFAWA